jgi:hypothetical protein
MCRLCSDAEFMHSVWQRYDALATDGDTSSASSARVPLLTSVLKCLVTSRLVLLGVSAQMHDVGIPVSDSQLHIHSHHSLDRITEMVVMDASATVSKDYWH